MRSVHVVASFALLAVAFGAAESAAQSAPVAVTGVVVDSTGAPLPGVNAVLLRGADAFLIGFAVADREGRFRIERVAPGSYRLRVTFVGYAPHEVPVEVGAADTDVGRLVLREAAAELGEIVVTERRTLAIRRDTVEYDATAVALQRGATVEELLRRLPGIEVEADGQIRARGQTVRRVLVDGEEFFPDAPTATTRHLPADAIDRVQLYDEQPPEGGRAEPTINLALKPDRKSGLFGRAVLGSGPTLPAERAPRFTGSLSLNRFSPRLRVSVLGGANNVNEPLLSFEEYLGLTGVLDLVGAPGGGTRITINLADAPVRVSEEGFVTSWLGGANVLRPLSPRSRLQTSYIGFGTGAERVRRTLRRQALGTEASFVETDDVEQNQARWAHRVNALARTTFGTDHDLRVRAVLTASGSVLDRTLARERSADDGTPMGSLLVAETTDSEAVGAALRAVYRRPFGASLSLHADAGVQGDARQASAALRAEGPLAAGSLEETGQGRTTGEVEAWVTTTGVLTLGGGHELIALAEARAPYHTLAQDGLAGATPGTFRRWMPSARVGLTHRRKRGAFKTLARLHLQALRFEAGFEGASPLQQRSALVAEPSLSVVWSGPRNQKLDLEVDLVTRQPTAAQLVPITDVSSPFQWLTGNPTLEPERRASVNVMYNYLDAFTTTAISASLSVDHTTNAVSSSRVTEGVLVPEATPINLGTQTTVSTQVQGSTALGRFDRVGQVVPRLVWTRGLELVNGRENAYDLLTLGVRLGLRLVPQGGPRVQVGSRLETRSTRFSLAPALSRTFNVITPYTETEWEPTPAWALRLRAEQEVYVGAAARRGAPRPLLTVKASRDAGFGGLRVGITLADVFDRSRYIDFRTTPFSTEETTAQALGRHAYVTLSQSL